MRKCLICEKEITYIPIGQRWKYDVIRQGGKPVFYHERCAG